LPVGANVQTVQRVPLAVHHEPPIQVFGIPLNRPLRINMGPSDEKRTHGHAASAPRGALLYPRLSREGLEGRFLGLMADLDGKPEGDNSMPGK